MRMLILSMAIGLAAFTPSMGRSQNTSQTLLNHKDWTVEFVQTRNSALCIASTSSRAGTRLSIFSIRGVDVFGLNIENPGWSLQDREAEIRVDVDYQRWRSVAELKDENISVFGLNPEFLDAIAYGNAVALKDSDDRNILTFSLRGSSAAMRALKTCQRSPARGSSPRSSTDPFARSNAGAIGDRPSLFGR